MSNAEDVIRGLIQHNGPIPVDQFINVALFFQNNGYYAENVDIGAHGDFVTAPVISSIFGEVIALYICDRILSHKMEGPITIIECGAGKGTMLLDIIRTLKKLKSLDVVSMLSKIVILEISQKLTAIQADTLKDCGVKVEWCKNILDINIDGHPIFIANEFLDAIPIKQYVFLNGLWYQRCIGIESGTHNFIFTQGSKRMDLVRYTQLIGLEDISHGKVIEIPDHGLSIFKSICSLVKSNSGCGLFIDYGYDHYQLGSTIQAIRKHHIVDIFLDVGSSDISHMVQFPLFLDAAQSLGLGTNLMKQKDFLDMYFINERLGSATTLVSSDRERLSNLKLSTARLQNTDMMGTMFHAMMIDSL